MSRVVAARWHSRRYPASSAALQDQSGQGRTYERLRYDGAMRYRRNFKPGGTFFFTVVTYRRRPIFSSHKAVAQLQDVVREIKSKRPFKIEAWVVMPDHLHMIWTLPRADADFSQRWSAIKSEFTRRWLAAGGTDPKISVGKRNEGRRGVWQPKFFEHTIIDEQDFISHVEYVHYNPVKHESVARPSQWPHSSFHEYVRRQVYPHDWCTGDGSDAPTLPYRSGAE